MQKRCLSVCLGLLLPFAYGVRTAKAEIAIFVSSGTDLFRISGGNVEKFDIGVGLAALAFDESGVLWGTGLNSTGDAGRMYKVADPFGTPSAAISSSANLNNVNAIDWVGDTLYAMERPIGSISDRKLVTLNPDSGATMPVGATGNTGAQIGGMAVDQVTGVMFAMDGAGFLLSVDWQLQGGADPIATQIGSLGAGSEGGGGLDFFEPMGTLYAVLALGGSPGNRPVGVYTVDTDIGLATEIVDLDPFDPGQGAFGIAVIPEPSSLVLLASISGALLMRSRLRKYDKRRQA